MRFAGIVLRHGTRARRSAGSLNPMARDVPKIARMKPCMRAHLLQRFVEGRLQLRGHVMQQGRSRSRRQLGVLVLHARVVLVLCHSRGPWLRFHLPMQRDRGGGGSSLAWLGAWGLALLLFLFGSLSLPAAEQQNPDPASPARSLTNGGFSSPTLCCWLGPGPQDGRAGRRGRGGEHGPYFNLHTFSKVISQSENPSQTGFSH